MDFITISDSHSYPPCTSKNVETKYDLKGYWVRSGTLKVLYRVKLMSKYLYFLFSPLIFPFSPPSYSQMFYQQELFSIIYLYYLLVIVNHSCASSVAVPVGRNWRFISTYPAAWKHLPCILWSKLCGNLAFHFHNVIKFQNFCKFIVGFFFLLNSLVLVFFFSFLVFHYGVSFQGKN